MLSSPDCEAAHDLLFQIAVEPAVQQADFQVGEGLVAEFLVHLECSLQFALLVFFDDGVDDVSLMSGGDLLAHEVPDFSRALVGDAARDDGRAAGRQFVEDTEVEVAVERQRQRSGDRRGGHDENVGLGRFSR